MARWLLAWGAVLACLALAPELAWANTLQVLQADVQQAVGRVRPSVVAIRAQKRELAPGGGEMWFESIGSGIVVDERGYILTNSHVVRGAARISAGFWQTPDRDFTATLVDDAPDLDLALLRVDGAGALPPAQLGDAASLALGQWVVSVGSPYGYEYSATLGIVSGLHRDLSINGVPYKDMIQTDATINQGNSGGPLVDRNGQVVGVSAAIFAPDKAYTGVGFAIPINRARQFISATIGAVPIAAQARPAALVAQNMAPVQPVPQRQLLPPLSPAAVQTPAAARQGFQPLPEAATTPAIAPQPVFQPLPPQAAQPAPLPPVLPAALAGIQTVATTVPKKTPIDLNKRMPRDAQHKKFADCRSCHDITKKTVANTNLQLPHAPLAGCDECHIVVNEKVAQGPTTVAWNVLSKLPGAGAVLRSDIAVCLAVGVAAFIAVALGIDAGLLFMPLLLLLGGLDIRLATAASLILVAVCGFPVFTRYIGAGVFDRKIFGIAGPAGLVGGFAGGVAAGYIAPDTLAPLLASTILASGFFMLRDPQLAEAWSGRADTGGLAWRTTYKGEDYCVELFSAMLLTGLAAFAGGMFGAAGAWLLLPLAMSLYRIPLGVAGALGCAMAPFAGLGGYLGQAVAGNFDPPLLVPLGLTALAGAAAGLFFAPIGRSTPGRLSGALLLGVAGVWLILRIADAI